MWWKDYRRDWLDGSHGIHSAERPGDLDLALAMGMGGMDGLEKDLEGKINTAWYLIGADSRMILRFS